MSFLFVIPGRHLMLDDLFYLLLLSPGLFDLNTGKCLDEWTITWNKPLDRRNGFIFGLDVKGWKHEKQPLILDPFILHVLVEVLL
jgi:hypothetical protein